MKVSKIVLLGALLLSTISSNVLQGSVADVQQFIKQHPDSLILFYSPRCPYCRYVMPLFDAVYQQYCSSKSCNMLKVDITTDNDDFGSAFDFSTVPAFIYYKKGTSADSHGSNNKTLSAKDIENRIKKLYF